MVASVTITLVQIFSVDTFVATFDLTVTALFGDLFRQFSCCFGVIFLLFFKLS